jgi:hypothetical protein
MTTDRDSIKKCCWMVEAMMTNPANTYAEWTLGNIVTNVSNDITSISGISNKIFYIAGNSQGALEHKIGQYVASNPHVVGDRSRAQDVIDRACVPTVNVEAYECRPSYRSGRVIAVMAYECAVGDNVYAGLEDKARRWLTAKGYKVEKAENEAKVYVELENAKKRIADLEDRIKKYNQATQLLGNVK